MAQDEDILAILSQPEKDEIRGQLTQSQKDLHDQLLGDIKKVKKNTRKRTDVDTTVLDSYESMWLKTEREKTKKADELIRQGASAEAINTRTKGIETERHAQWEAAARVEYGLAGGLAIQELNATQQPPRGPVDNVKKMFYDPQDGGVQWGGIAGALGGIFLGMNLGGMFGGGWMSIIAIIGGALVGGWLGNKGGDFVSGLFDRGDNSPATARAPGQQKNLQPGSPENQSQLSSQQVAVPEGLHLGSGGENIDRKDSAQLPAQPAPAQKPGEQKSQQPG